MDATCDKPAMVISGTKLTTLILMMSDMPWEDFLNQEFWTKFNRKELYMFEDT